MSSTSNTPKKRKADDVVSPEPTLSSSESVGPDFNVLSEIPRLFLMDFQSSDETIVTEALIRVASLCSAHPEKEQKRSEVFNTGGHLAIIAVMKKWHDFPDIQVAACKAIANAACGVQSQFRESAAKVGALVAIPWAMKSYPENEELQLFACGALMNLFVANDNAVQFIKLEGSLGLLFAALECFPDNRILQKYGVAAVFHACGNEELRAPIVKAGGIELLGKACRVFVDDSNEIEKSIRIFAGGALKKLMTVIPG